ncbi:MAG: hypothetical protein JOZ42_09850 [Acetobacteraceae bacterium]|nr:hypothetical protein [Acetobacteraceae bacterium]
MTSPIRKPAETDDDFVEAFLSANPGWLAERPHLYRVLTPPLRVHGEHLADHMAAMIRAERVHAAAMAARADGVLAAGRAAAGLQTRVQAAAVALLRTHDPIDCITSELPGVIAVDAAALCIEKHQAGARTLPPGAVAKLLGGRDVVFRTAPADAPILHGEAAELARYDALVRVPGQPGALLALVARDAVSLDPSQGAGPLAFLGRAVAAALGR